jgi:gluconate 2-dehydrogenase gamma chain
VSPIDRRTALKLMGVTPFMGTLEWSPEEIDRAALHVQTLPASDYAPLFFTEHEWQTVQVLADLIIPRDDRSGSATDAKAPEFVDFILNESSESRQSGMRRGFAWLDEESRSRFGVAFVGATDAQRRQILDDIAGPGRAPERLSAGVSFFNSIRDLVAAGFFSSKMGYDDLQYIGNVPVREFPGCPEAALRKLGVSYDLMPERR